MGVTTPVTTSAAEAALSRALSDELSDKGFFVAPTLVETERAV